jgi:NadR type nicotinamide-nucleotide adenylyltransferase
MAAASHLGGERPLHGFVLGKFMPPHAGHVFLCDFARAYCERLTILVCSLGREPIPGPLRVDWMRRMFPGCRVMHVDHDLPQAPEEHPEFWAIWRDVVLSVHPEPIDVVFASESYGLRLAEEVGARFIPVDPHRETFPVSGTQIRADPLGCWRFLPPVVRPHYLRRVCLFGPESTGKTTLAGRLARRFGTVATPEYGRTYTEAFGVHCEPVDLHRIAAGQLAAEEAAAAQADRLLICDTDVLLTRVWSQMLTGKVDPQLPQARRLCDLYLLTGVDAPWVDDGTRYFPDQSARARFFELCRSELDRAGARYVVLQGDWAQREEAAVAAVRDVLDLEPDVTA